MNKALLVGINHYAAPNTLYGCVNDITDMSEFLVDKCDFSLSDIRLLVDERATKDAIIDRLVWLVSGCREGDRLLFHYSGHGIQFPVRDVLGNVAIVHEGICPIDFDWTEETTIFDTDFTNIFSSVPAGVEFIWVSDSCYSGGLLRAMLRPGARKKTITPPLDINWRLKTALAEEVDINSISKAMTACRVALLSACTSYQESEDTVFENDRPNGAFTHYLLQELDSQNGLTEPLTSVVSNIVADLADYGQTPQIEGDNIITSEPFLAASPVTEIN